MTMKVRFRPAANRVAVAAGVSHARDWRLPADYSWRANPNALTGHIVGRGPGVGQPCPSVFE